MAEVFPQVVSIDALKTHNLVVALLIRCRDVELMMNPTETNHDQPRMYTNYPKSATKRLVFISVYPWLE